MKIIPKSPKDKDSVLLMEELSDTLKKITGNSGKHSFVPEEVCKDRAVFAVAYAEDMQAIGCGAIRPYSKEIAEVKRMYAKRKGEGIGRALLLYLQKEAKRMNYTTLYAETRKINTGAVAFYLKNGYERIENYGAYKEKENAICFQKKL